MGRYKGVETESRLAVEHQIYAYQENNNKLALTIFFNSAEDARAFMKNLTEDV